MKMRIRKTIPFKDSIGKIFPWYWGVAYVDHLSAHAVFYIIPLNWIVWIFREIYFKSRFTPQDTLERTYLKGFQDGFHQGCELNEKD